jgi:hypothetical protein
MNHLDHITNSYDCGILDKWFAAFWSDVCRFDFTNAFWKISENDINRWSDIEIKKKRKKLVFSREIDDRGDFFSGGFTPYGITKSLSEIK